MGGTFFRLPLRNGGAILVFEVTGQDHDEVDDCPRNWDEQADYRTGQYELGNAATYFAYDHSVNTKRTKEPAYDSKN